MTVINIHEAKTHFSKLIDSVIAGKEVVIAKAGKPIAVLSPLPKAKVRFGVLKGKIKINRQFDTHLTLDHESEVEAKT